MASKEPPWRQTRRGFVFSPYGEDTPTGADDIRVISTTWVASSALAAAEKVQKDADYVAEVHEGVQVLSRPATPQDSKDLFEEIAGSPSERNPSQSDDLEVSALLEPWVPPLSLNAAHTATASGTPNIQSVPVSRRVRRRLKKKAELYASDKRPIVHEDSNQPANTPLPVHALQSASLPGPSLNSASIQRRKRKRESEVEKRATVLHDSRNLALTYKVKPSTIRKYSQLTQFTQTGATAVKLPHSESGSWVGQRQPKTRTKPWTIQELEDKKFKYVKYEPGKNVFFTDTEGFIIGGLLDRPPSSDWLDVLREAARCLRMARVLGMKLDAFTDMFFNHRRGPFLAIPVGVSMGGGQKQPGNLVHRVYIRRKIIRSILKNSAIRRVAGYQSSGFAFLAPKLFRRYQDDLGGLFEHHSDSLEWNFDNSIYPATSFNCGPKSVSISHFDYGNLSNGLCVITPFGNFNWHEGGHLVLEELELVVEFPPGTSAYLLSAAIKHSNTGIKNTEERYSMTQYAAGGLFRWKAHGYKSAKELLQTAKGRAIKAEISKEDGERWGDGIKLFSKTSTWLSDHHLGSSPPIASVH